MVESPEDAVWYQSFTWPDGSETLGAWDYRGREDDFLGRQDFRGKAVLELGPASGFLTKEMEARGASVTCIDTADDEPWEAVPRKDRELQRFLGHKRDQTQRLRASWWYSQRRFDSNARVAYVGSRPCHRSGARPNSTSRSSRPCCSTFATRWMSCTTWRSWPTRSS